MNLDFANTKHSAGVVKKIKNIQQTGKSNILNYNFLEQTDV